MKIFFKYREIVLLTLLVFLPLTLISTTIYVEMTGGFNTYEETALVKKWGHGRVINGTAHSPQQIRIMVPFLVEGTRRLTGWNLNSVYVIFRILFTLAAAVALYHYYLIQSNRAFAAAGVLYFFASIPIVFSHWKYPDYMPFLLSMVLGGIFILRDKKTAFRILIFLGTFNRAETGVWLILLYFFFHFRWRKRDFLALVRECIILSLFFGGAVAILRLRYGNPPNFMDDKQHLAGFPLLSESLGIYRWYFFGQTWDFKNIFTRESTWMFYMFVPFLVFFMGFFRSTDFRSRKILIYSFLYYVFYFSFAKINELRGYSILVYAVFPLVIFQVLRERDCIPGKSRNTSPTNARDR